MVLPIIPKNISKKTKKDWVTDTVFIIALLSFIYFFYLGKYPLFTPDEGRYSEVAREMVISGDYITPRINGIAFLDKPILYYWLQAISISFFGIKEWALRLFPVLFGIFGCLTTYFCGRQLFNRATGLISSLILSTAPLYFGGAHYANLDLELAVLVSASLLFFITGMQSANHHRFFMLASYLFAALAFLTKGLIGVAFPLMVGGLWLICLRQFNLLKKLEVFKGLCLFILLTAPWYILVQKANPEFFHYFFVTQQIGRFLSTDFFNNYTPVWFFIPVILIGFFPWTIFFLQYLKQSIKKVWNDKNNHQVELFLLLWIGAIFTFFSIPHSKITTYILPIFPALALLTGRFLTYTWNNTATKDIIFSSVGIFITGIVLSILCIFLLYVHAIDYSLAFTLYLKLIAGILCVFSFVSILLIKRKNLHLHYLISFLCNVIILLTLTTGAQYLNNATTKPLVQELKQIIHPEDEVVTYFNYYQDLPLYLGRQITIVNKWNADEIAKKDNWMREMSLGIPLRKNNDWLINEEIFWQRWESEKRVFVFLNKNQFNHFKLHAKSYFYLSNQYDIILLSNEPTFLTAQMKKQWLKNKFTYQTPL